MSTMSDAAGKSAATNYAIYNEARNNLYPYKNLGDQTVPYYGGILNIPGYADVNPTQALRDTPGYNWMLSEGADTIDRSAAARGMLNSGPQGKQLMAFGEGLADQTYNNYMNKLWAAINQGQQTAAQQGQLGTQYARNTQDAMMQAAQTDTQVEAMQQQGGFLNSLLGGVGLLGSLALSPAKTFSNSLIGSLFRG